MGDTPEQKEDVAALAQEMSAITDYIRQCAARIRRGEVLDLSGLDRAVAHACAAATVLPADEARKLETPMTQMIETLDALAETLRAQQEGGAA